MTSPVQNGDFMIDWIQWSNRHNFRKNEKFLYHMSLLEAPGCARAGRAFVPVLPVGMPERDPYLKLSNYGAHLSITSPSEVADRKTGKIISFWEMNRCKREYNPWKWIS
jgi:hypothetical protein